MVKKALREIRDYYFDRKLPEEYFEKFDKGI